MCMIIGVSHETWDKYEQILCRDEHFDDKDIYNYYIYIYMIMKYNIVSYVYTTTPDVFNNFGINISDTYQHYKRNATKKDN